MIPLSKKKLKQLGLRLIAKKQTVAVAESVTAGYLQWTFSQIPDAAQFFQGGLTAYNLGQKYKHLQVEPVHAQQVNCVSQQVASQMALNISKEFSSDWGLGITGYATAVPESGNNTYAYFAIAYRGKIKNKGLIKPAKAKPELLQAHFARYVLKKFSSLL